MTLSEPCDFGSDVGAMSEGSRSPESYDTLDKLVMKSRKKRTRTNSQQCSRKPKRKEKLKGLSNVKSSLTAFDSTSTSLTCRLKKFRQLKVERSISSVVSSCEQSSNQFSSILSNSLKHERIVSSRSSSWTRKTSEMKNNDFAVKVPHK